MLPVLRGGTATAPLASGPIGGWDTLSDGFFRGDGAFLGPAWAGMPMAMWDDEDHLFIEADLPGVAENDVDVTIHQGTLFIRGGRRPEEGRRYLYNGRSFGRFERAIALPEAVRTDDVKAELRNGVLSITLPKSPEARPRKIALRAG